ncbi:Tudor domain-containing protein 1 [Nymphon striatum]|nr:Tudor domain-containing protein 1 [Nymphon striatum]
MQVLQFTKSELQSKNQSHQMQVLQFTKSELQSKNQSHQMQVLIFQDEMLDVSSQTLSNSKKNAACNTNIQTNPQSFSHEKRRFSENNRQTTEKSPESSKNNSLSNRYNNDGYLNSKKVNKSPNNQNMPNNTENLTSSNFQQKKRTEADLYNHGSTSNVSKDFNRKSQTFKGDSSFEQARAHSNSEKNDCNKSGFQKNSKNDSNQHMNISYSNKKNVTSPKSKNYEHLKLADVPCSNSQITNTGQSSIGGGKKKDFVTSKEHSRQETENLPKQKFSGGSKNPEKKQFNPAVKDLQANSRIPEFVDRIYTEADLKTMEIPDEILKVTYCFGFSWDQLYVHLNSSSGVVEMLTAKLRDHCDSITNSNSVKPAVGQICAAKWLGDWYRAKICEVNESSVMVQFVDYGNSDVTPIDNLRPLNSELMQIPPQAICCKLHNVEPIHKVWCEDSIGILTDICIVEFYIKIIERNHTNEVEVYEDPKGASINMLLVEKNLAKTTCNADQSLPNAVSTPKRPDSSPNSRKTTTTSPKINDATINRKTDGALQIPNPDSCDDIEDIKNILEVVNVGEEVNLIIMVDNEKEYWALLQLEGRNYIIDCQSEIQARYNNALPSDYSPTKGEIVAAKSSYENEWYRARIQKKLPESYIVFYIDFGNYEEVDVVMKLEKEFKTEPSCAVRCHRVEQDSSVNLKLEQSKTYWGKIESKNNDNIVLSCDINGSICKILCYSDFLQSNDVVETDLELAKEYAVEIISIHDLQGIYFVKSDDFVTLASATTDYNDYCLSLKQKGYDAVVEEIVFAKFEGDWYRGNVISITDEGTYMVQYIDFGNVSEVEIENIRRMPRKFAKLPKFSYCGSLHNVNILSMTPEMESIIHRAKTLKVVKKADEHLVIQLWTENGKLVADILQKLTDANQQNLLNSEENICKSMDKKLNISNCEEAAKPCAGSGVTTSDQESEVEVPTQPKMPPPLETVNSSLESAGDYCQPSNGKDSDDLHMYSDCTHVIPEVGEEKEYTVLAMMSPDIINCGSLNADDVQKMNELSEKITKECENLNEAGYCPQTGELCLAKYSDDEMWYRAAAISPNEDKWFVLFVDYGNFATVDVNNIKKISKYYADIPILVFSCKLDGVDPIVDECWPSDIGEKLSELFQFPYFLSGRVVHFVQDTSTCVIDFPDMRERIVAAGLAKLS